ncbi:MAG TPA: glycosyl transferase, partial [Bacteroidetes bacterium]|nr:glycosyl transferase [Bacteroidota bacterium]
MNFSKLSVLVPAYNEEATIVRILDTLQSVQLPEGILMELVVVNDCSTDRTGQIVEQYIAQHPDASILYEKHAKNAGKGAALHTAIQLATGDLIVVQDADLEYDPHEFSILLKPFLAGQADVVYGSRFMGGNPHRILFFWHSIGNRFLTFFSNMFSNLNLTDMETCYKMVRADILKSLVLKEKRFGFEPEVTQKLARIKG